MNEREKKEQITNHYLSKLVEALKMLGEDVVQIGSNAIAFSLLETEEEIFGFDELPNLPRNPESWCKIVFSIPTGSKSEDFDGRALAEDYELKVVDRAEKKKKAAEERQRKFEQKKKLREVRAKKEKEREEKGGE